MGQICRSTPNEGGGVTELRKGFHGLINTELDEGIAVGVVLEPDANHEIIRAVGQANGPGTLAFHG